ncbi:hypothetical protein NSU_2308 [Novosphingobium pentaromativorans US6-1]|uniref:Uncharacterized protein n=1 Tax=Novosphingobium pentaromativorans US6-1 TaxID=1088721 RepID=G6ED87_9SPHN|nr:hypothetical protein NSU_2308 [Novosphingobium pentaromativorans US6-1]
MMRLRANIAGHVARARLSARSRLAGSPENAAAIIHLDKTGKDHDVDDA